MVNGPKTALSVVLATSILIGCERRRARVPVAPPDPQLPAAEIAEAAEPKPTDVAKGLAAEEGPPPGPAQPEEPPVPEEESRLVYGFETEEEAKEIGFTSTTSALTMQPERVTQGESALAVTFKKTTPESSQWPGFRIGDKSRLSGWEEYDLLAMDVANLTDENVSLHFRFDDAKTDEYETRAHTDAVLAPGPNTVSIPLKSLRRAIAVPFEVSTLRGVSIFLSVPKRDVQLIFDNMRLQKEVTVEIDIPNAHLFDFSAEGALTFPGFVKVTPADAYDAGRGYGFLSTEGLKGSGKAMPDDLLGDWVSSRDEFTFRVDVPDGRYHVSYGLFLPGVGDYTVAVGGEERKVAWTAEKVFSKEGIYFGIDHDYAPGMDVWSTYVMPAWPVETVEAEATDGTLEVRVKGARLASLVVHPVSQAARMEPVLAEVTQRRRKQFAKEYCTVRVPESGEAKPTQAEERAGYIVFTPSRTEPVTPGTAPSETKTPSLSVKAARGQREPATFAVLPLRAFEEFSVRASSLRGRGGMSIPVENVEVRLVRYFLKKSGTGSYAPAPGQLVPAETPLYAGLTRQYWVTVNVPSDTKPGEYRGSLELMGDGSTSKLPLHLTVYPFELPYESRAALGWYYVGPQLLQRQIRRFDDSPISFEEALERQFLDMKRHGMIGLQVPQPKITAFRDNRITFGYDELDVYVKLMKKHGIGLGGRAQMFVINIANYLMRRGLKEFSDEFNAAFKTAIAEIDKWFKDRGVEVIIWLVDEPREQAINPWNRNLRDTIRYLGLARELPGVKTTICVMRDDNFGVDYTPMVPLMDILQTHPRPGSTKIIAMTQKPGGPVLWSDNPGHNRVSYGFHLWKLNGLGCFQWHYQWGDTSYNPFVGYHWAVAYPSPDGPVPTWAYEQVAMGCTDYRYIELLEHLATEAKQKGNDASSAERLLKRLRDDIPQWPMQEYGDGTDAGREYRGGVNTKLDVWRSEIAKEIVRLDALLER